MISQPPRFKLTAFILLLVFLSGIIAVSYVEMGEVEAKKIKKTQPLKKIKTIGKNAPRIIKMNKTHIFIKSWKCGCGKNYNKYKFHKKTMKLKNYCPFCHKYGVLRYNLKGNIAEGEFTCKKCGADFCCDGNDKSWKVRKKIPKWT